MLFYQAGIAEADLEPSGDTSGIAAALGRLDEAEPVFQKALDDVVITAKDTTVSEHAANAVVIDSGAKNALLLSLIQLRGKLDGYKPVDKTKQKKHDSMVAYVDALRAKSEQRTASINKIVDSAPWTAKLKKDPEPVVAGGSESETAAPSAPPASEAPEDTTSDAPIDTNSEASEDTTPERVEETSQ